MARVAVCITAFEYGGQGTVVEQELTRLRDKFELTLVAERISRPVPTGIEAIQMSAWQIFPKSNPSLRKLLRTFDLVHCHDSLGMMLAATSSRKPVVVTAHGVAPVRLRATVRDAIEAQITLLTYARLYRSADVVVTYSQFIASWLRAFARVEPTIIPLGVEHVVTSAPRRPSRRNLLYVGEVSRRKGIRELIDGVTLDIVGKGTSEPFKRQAKRRGIPDRIRFAGLLSPEDLSTAYAAAFCTCSASYWEGLGLPVLEGFSFGRPSIVRSQGGMLELVKQSGAGCHFTRHEEIATCIESVTDNWEQFSTQALDFARLHTWPRTFQAYAELFDATLKGTPGDGI